MFKKFKCISLLFVTVFMLQSILIPVVSVVEAKNTVMEISIPLLSLTTLAITDNSVDLVWTSSDYNITATSYEIYRNDSLIKKTGSFAYTDTELTPKTEYTYRVKAKSTDGKVITESNALDVTTHVELDEILTAPDIAETNITVPNITVPENMTRSAITIDQAETEELANFEGEKLFKKDNPDFETDRFIIKYKNENGKIKARKAFEKIDKIEKNKINELKNNKNKDIDIISLNKKEKIKDFATDLQKYELENYIEYIQPDYQFSLSTNDPYYSSQWGFGNISDEAENPNNISISENVTYTTTSQSAILIDAGVTEAWNISTGSGITVAVIDTGVDILHEDLAENIWVNTGEISGNGIDDDGNGKIDDSNGWNFSEDNNVVCDISNLENENHGTHVAGIIAAVKDNGKGIAGVAPGAKVMPLKVFKDGMAYTSDIISAIHYAESMNVKIVNCSWGSSADNTAIKEAIENSNMLFVCAAGNNSMNIDKNPVYPAAFDCSNIITVASANRNGGLSGFSNYGKNSVDVAAPGEEIISTVPGKKYELKSGTSMAAAFVSGEAALILSENKDISLVNTFFLVKQKSNALFGNIEKMNLSGIDNITETVKNITLFDNHIYQASKDFSTTVQGQNGWYYMKKTSTGIYNEMTWDFNRNCWSGSNACCLVGPNYMHPDENDSVRKWVAPYSGTILISANGNIRKSDTSGGDGINVSLSKNDKQIWNAYIGGTDGIGIKFPERIVDVNTGDVIYFTVNRNHENYCDGSIWDPIIEYKDPLIYQASKDFSTTVQGQNGWYYIKKTSTGIYNEMTWDSNRNCWSGSNACCLMGPNYMHPDENDSVRKWVAPYSGTILISANGNIRKSDTSGGDGINVSLSKNNMQIWNEYIGGTDGVGIKFPERIVDVNAGDVIYFTVNKNQDNYFDGSIWDQIIEYKDSLIYQASKDFSTTVQGQNGWYYMKKTSTGIYNEMTWDSNRNCWSGSNACCLLGPDYMHPDENDSVRKWVAPYSGTILISANGNIRKSDTNGGDGINVSLSKNNTQIWNEYIGGTDGVGIKFPERIVDVNAGDVIYFTVNKNQDNYFDGSIWDQIIEYKDSLIYQASKDFSTTVQGQNGWYYMKKTSTGIYNEMTWDSNRNCWSGSNACCLLGPNYMHPDENDSVRKWVAPYSGTILISANGNLKKSDTNGGDGINVSLSKNNTQIWNAYIGGTDGVGIKFPERIEDVNAGDVIYFTVNKNQDNYFDGLIWDPTIMYKGEKYEYQYGINNQLIMILKEGKEYIKLIYDNNGNLIKKQKL